MTDISIIQRARDALAKWRSDEEDPMPYWTEDQHFGFGDSSARLIVGTAGNPDLLDAIDAMLATYLAAHSIGPTYRRDSERIAAAIIAADERMTS
jgi:hypothetical protein